MGNSTVTRVIQLMLQEWNHKGYSARFINCGNCDEFAAGLVTHFKTAGGKAFWGEDNPHLFSPKFPKDLVIHGSHCFFKLHGLYYDSEAPSGVTSPELLPYYQRCYANKFQFAV